MGVPKEIKVGPYHYRIFCDHARMSRARLDFDGGRIGQCDFHHQEIVIDPDSAEDMKVETLLHEIIHAILDLTRPFEEDIAGKDKMEEKVICSISPLLLDVLRTNPEFVNYLMNE